MRDDDGSGLGAVLREQRARTGMTQRELAELAGVSVRTVRAIEHGQVRTPHAASLRQLAVVLRREHEPGELSVGVLGPLRVRSNGTEVPIGSPQQRGLLGLLALHAGRTVTEDEIVDVLWADRPPPTYRTVLHGLVSRLRKALRHGRSVLVSEPGGYVLRASTDLARFDELDARARLAGAGADAAELFTAALSCWQGPVLADLPERLRAHPSAVAAARRRLAAALAHADVAPPEKSIHHLRALLDEDPLHEGLHARLVLATAATGQQAEALALFTRIRDRLDADLGIEPGEELRAAQRIVLHGQARAHNCLPHDIADFTGRHAERRAVLAGGPVTVIDGMPGIGKTALAVHVAHELGRHHADGQLFLDLRATAVTDALASLLRQAGVPDDRIPARFSDRVALWRSHTAARSMVVVLDNASDPAQVRPLLPNGSHSRTLITGLTRLTGLEGVRRVSLTVLPRADAVALFTRVSGRSDRAADPVGSVDEVLRLCGHLPLAVRMAGAKARAHPSWSVAHLADRLRDERRRLGELRLDEAFARSYDRLGGPLQQLFRLLGDSAVTEFDAHSAAAIAGVSHDEAQHRLDALYEAHLLVERAPGRFRFHGLLRLYARAAALRAS